MLLKFEDIHIKITNLRDYEENSLLRIKQLQDHLVIFIVSTYGEGDPPDSGRRFHEQLQISTKDLSGLNYLTFGLGNSIYPKFNTFAKFVDKRMKELGAKRELELNLGDANFDLEADFLRWCSCVKERLLSTHELTLGPNASIYEPKYLVKILDSQPDLVWGGEFGKYDSFVVQEPPFDEENPFMATIIRKKELAKSSERRFLHVELDIYGSRLKYEPGDYVGIFAQNDNARIKQLVDFMGINYNRLIDMEPQDDSEENLKKHFPTPCTIRTALKNYLDTQRINDPNIFSALAHYTTDEKEKSFLLRLSADDLEGMALRKSYISEAGRDILEVLQEFKSCKVPIEILVQILPRLTYRHYSISSRPDNNPLPSTLHVTLSVVQYRNKLDRLVKGVCTSYLEKLRPGCLIPIFITRSQFHLPQDPKTPIILIGPGTGIAPLRSFLQKRDQLQKEGHVLGLCLLFFGCRHEDSEYLYKSELEDYLEKGVITNLYTAFSRDPPKTEKDRELLSMTSQKKIYVQHRMAQASAVIWQVITSKGVIYISGDANSMAKDVNKTLLHILADRGKKSVEEAAKYLDKLKATGRYNIDVWS